MFQQNRTVLSSATKTALWVAFALFLAKIGAYLLSGSAAIFSDAAASIAYLASLLFTTYGLYVGHPNPERTAAHDTGTVDSPTIGFEGAVVILTGLFTLAVSLFKYFVAAPLSSLELSTSLIALAALLHASLGLYLIRLGKRERERSVEKHGRTVLFNSYLSVAVIAGLLLYSFSGKLWVDSLFGVLLSFYILSTGIYRLRRSFGALADRADTTVTRQLTELLSQCCAQHGISFHKLHHRNEGNRHLVDLHLVFPPKTEIGEAHRIAAAIEVTLIGALSNHAHILTHLESRD